MIIDEHQRKGRERVLGPSRKGPERPVGVLVKPTSSRCNLNCAYCFYLSKMELYPWRDHPKLTIETYEEFLKQYVPMSAPFLSFTWQGGEPTIMGLEFYEQVDALQRRYSREFNPASPPVVGNSIQTNGTMLNDDWVKFFKRSNFLVGVSLDGPPELHNRYRVDWSGRPTYDRVMAGIDLLRSRDVPFNVLTVVSRSNVHQPRELLLWLYDQGFTYPQFIPLMEVQPGSSSAETGGVTDESLTPDQWASFLSGIFDTWQEIGVEKLRIRWFDNLVQMLWGFPNEACTLAQECGYILLEHNGDCYPCDFFVEPDQLLGNVHEGSLREMLGSEMFRRFSQAKSKLHADCTECPWLTLCYGECPKYRVANVGVAEYSLPYFCRSFKQFFGQNYHRLEELAIDAAGRRGLAVPRGTMPAGERTNTRPISITAVHEAARKNNVGRNGPCPCGSGRKYKRCCSAANIHRGASQTFGE